MANSIITKKFNISAASEVVQSIQSETAHYVFAGGHFGTSTPVTPGDSDNQVSSNVYNNMIFGKRIYANNVSAMIPRTDWETATAYSIYDDTDTGLFDKQFYVGVEDGSNYRVYKCLYNNNGANSTVEPSGTSTTVIESTVDGYIWKYMYTANSTLMGKFSTTDYVPVAEDAAVKSAAVGGSIEVILVQDAGVGYDNYIESGEFSASQLRIGGVPTRYGLGADASSTPDFYNGCLIYMTSGAAEGEYREITNYYISEGNKVIELDSAFTEVVSSTDSYEIYPNVYIYDNGGRKTSNCVARAIVNSSSGNSISKIEVITPGAGYRAATAVIKPDPTVAVSANAALRPVISPPGGHGSNVADELGANYVCIQAVFDSDNDALTTDNDYRQIGIISDPLFTNVAINFTSNVGSFIVDETVYQYNDSVLIGEVDIESGNTVLSGTNTLFEGSLQVGSQILVTDGIHNFYASVDSITSNTALEFTTEATFTNTGCTISLVNAVSYGVVTSVDDTNSIIYVSNVSTSGLTSSIKLLGGSQYCTAEVDIANTTPVTINGRNVNNFNTFTQLTKLEGNITSGTFQEDEYIYQPSTDAYARPSARVYSAIESGSPDYMYVTAVNNSIVTSGLAASVMTGNSSGATFTVTAKYDGELLPDSGRVLYLENLNAVSRANGQNETIKLILEL